MHGASPGTGALPTSRSRTYRGAKNGPQVIENTTYNIDMGNIPTFMAIVVYSCHVVATRFIRETPAKGHQQAAPVSFGHSNNAGASHRHHQSPN